MDRNTAEKQKSWLKALNAKFGEEFTLVNTNLTAKELIGMRHVLMRSKNHIVGLPTTVLEPQMDSNKAIKFINNIPEELLDKPQILIDGSGEAYEANTY